MPNLRAMAGALAWKMVTTKGRLRWEDNLGRFGDPVFSVHHEPKFRLSADEHRFFCIGSCFARNLEEHLIYNGLKVLSRRISIPKTEWIARPNGIVNKFTTASILNEIDWLDSPPDLDQDFFVQQSDGWLDLQLSPGAKPVSLERAIERRHYLMEEYFNRIREADVIVITLGLDEVWVDKRLQRSLNTGPPFWCIRRDPARYVLEISTYEQNLQSLETLYEKLALLCPAVRYVITVSPVPMEVSFSGLDPAVATTRAKSVLRAVAQAFADAHDNVDYFPSYEMIAYSPRSAAFAADCRHVKDDAVRAIIGYFIERYLNRQATAPEGFTELGYLEANPDVDTAVRSGLFESGYEHWKLHGRGEGRPLVPQAGPTPAMIRGGAA